MFPLPFTAENFSKIESELGIGVLIHRYATWHLQGLACRLSAASRNRPVVASSPHRPRGDGRGFRAHPETPAIRLRTMRPSAYGPFRRSGTGPANPAWEFRPPPRPRPLFSARRYPLGGGTGPVPCPGRRVAHPRHPPHPFGDAEIRAVNLRMFCGDCSCLCGE